jgi:WbqC-like protein family
MSSNKDFLIDNHCFPLISSIKCLFVKTNVFLFLCDRIEKAGFSNRYVIIGSSGLIKLSVPIVGGRSQKKYFKDVRISYNENWQVKHWRTLESCYNKSPFFEFYREDVKKFFTKREDFLFDWNLSILLWLKEVLKFPAIITVTENYPEGTEDFRRKSAPSNFQEQEFLIRYPQVFEERVGFIKNVSILDLLFNTGPQASEYLKKLSDQKK